MPKERFIALGIGAAGVLIMAVTVRLSDQLSAGLGYGGVILGGLMLMAAGWIISPRRKKLKEKRQNGQK